MNHNYHKTIQIPTELHNKFIDEAIKQELMILEFFRYAPSGLTRWEAFLIMHRFKEKPSQSSCGRAVSNLFRDDKILATEQKRHGEYTQHDNTVYIFNPNPRVKLTKHNIKLDDYQVFLLEHVLNDYAEIKTDDPSMIEFVKTIIKKLPKIDL